MARLQQVKKVAIAGYGTLPLADDSHSFKADGIKRDHKAGRNKADGGFTEANPPAELDITCNAKRGIDAHALRDMDDVQVTITLSDGTTWIMANAWTEEPADLGDGDLKVKFVSNESETL